MAFFITNCLFFVPKPVAQTHSDVEGTGMAASRATQLAANQAPVLPNEKQRCRWERCLFSLWPNCHLAH